MAGWDTESAILFDVDGVIAPFTFRAGLDHLAAPGHGTVMFDPAIVHRMAAIPVTQAWPTSCGSDPSTPESCHGQCGSSDTWAVEASDKHQYLKPSAATTSDNANSKVR
ncbi:hypothetical protein OOZ51_18135 [Arthrobacter sp. MI7-26]|uniref:hypothetical protein n=1 Tax=Arthrobacter sp. MI7-26 TaxID=2993653 RepID=UPI0022490C9D|nr:hypothetical protein [Arthrobacter sp. MI7-26]MCX2749714.1 hypothetical protein [Arthrobacter sp. MI7-26]